MKLFGGVIGPALLALCLLPPAYGQVTLGQIDTFEDGTTQGWIVGDPGHPAPPTNIPSGGPAGVDDNYLLLTATGLPGPGGRLASFNTQQWAGDYLAAGITHIALDARNFGPSDVSLRLLFADAMGGPPNNIAITDAWFLPAGGGWTHLLFDVTPARLIPVLGDVSAALRNATELRLFHNPAPEFPGPPFGIPRINVQFGADNIQAVPEPSTLLCMGMGLLPLAWRRLPRRRRAR